MSIRTVRRRSFAAGAAALAVAPAARAAGPPWIDAHTHVFLRGLPMAIDARYRPDHDASRETLLALAEKNGVGRAVQVSLRSALGVCGLLLRKAGHADR